LAWALQLLKSPRPFEADSGAGIISLVHDIYVLELKWSILIQREVGDKLVARAAEASHHEDVGSHMEDREWLASLRLLESLQDEVEAAVVCAEEDMVKLCRESFLQGRLIALQRLIEAFPWNRLLDVGGEVIFSAPIECLTQPLASICMINLLLEVFRPEVAGGLLL
jgi:hypothetical protein